MFNVFFLLICITRFHAKGYICCCEVHPLPAVLGVKSIGYKSPPTWHERGASTVKNIIQRYTQNSYIKYNQVKVTWNSKLIDHMIWNKLSIFYFSFKSKWISYNFFGQLKQNLSADSILKRIKMNYCLTSNHNGYLMLATFKAFFSRERYIFLRLSNFNGSSNKMAELLILV